MKIVLERKGTCHICMEMEISKPMKRIRVFEKDILGYNSDSKEIVEFEITDRDYLGFRIFREI